MADQVYWDDVQEGTELPAVVKNPTTQQLVKYAGASGDYYQIHYDQGFAKNNDLDDVILHGALKNAFLGHLVTKWMGADGDLKRLACQYRHGYSRHPGHGQGRCDQEIPRQRRQPRRLRHMVGEREGREDHPRVGDHRVARPLGLRTLIFDFNLSPGRH